MSRPGAVAMRPNLLLKIHTFAPLVLTVLFATLFLLRLAFALHSLSRPATAPADEFFDPPLMFAIPLVGLPLLMAALTLGIIVLYVIGVRNPDWIPPNPDLMVAVALATMSLILLPVVLMLITWSIVPPLGPGYRSIDLPPVINYFWDGTLGFVILWLIGLLIVYLSHLLKTGRMSKRAKSRWAAGFLVGGFVVMVVYWFLIIQKKQVAGER